MAKTGNKLILFLSCVAVSLALAPNLFADEFTATPSSTTISREENVMIDLKISTDQIDADIGNPKYAAPDFEEVNSYASVQSVNTFVDMNKMTTVTRRSSGIRVVLMPKRSGQLKITNLSVVVNGKTLRADDISIDVLPEGKSPRGSHGGGVTLYPDPSQLQGSGARAPVPGRGHARLFIKTEPSKLRVYKGEQIILTYALYTRVKILNVQVERFPNVIGFLKEDIDIPLLRGLPDVSRAVVNGQEYYRGVMAQYAIYPLKEGSLPIDTFTGKFSVVGANRPSLDDDDDFSGLANMFLRSMQTTTESHTSDRVTIEVLPLPKDGQPVDFSGLVGDFEITAVADKVNLKAGEPLTLKVKVDGKGHAGNLERLNIKWPKEFELYEDKSNTQFLKTGMTERIFDFMVIPKEKGRFEIPAIELSMFNPDTKTYVVRKTAPIVVDVSEGSVGTTYVAKGQVSPVGNSPAAPKEELRPWMLQSETSTSDRNWGSKLRVLAIILSFLSFVFVVISLVSAVRRSRLGLLRTKSQQASELVEKAKAILPILESGTTDVNAILARIEEILRRYLKLNFDVSIKSMTRAEIRDVLAEKPNKKAIDEATVKRIERLLERCESLRYAPKELSGAISVEAVRGACQELVALVER